MLLYVTRIRYQILVLSFLILPSVLPTKNRLARIINTNTVERNPVKLQERYTSANWKFIGPFLRVKLKVPEAYSSGPE